MYIHIYIYTHSIYTKILVRCYSGLGCAFERRRQLARKHRYLPHGSHFGAPKWPLGGCCWSARRAVPGLLRRRRCAQNGRSGLPWCRQCARKGCSGLLRRRQCAQSSRSGPLWCRQCARKVCWSSLQCRQCTQRGCSRLLFEITIQKCWSRLHCALSHCTLLFFATCMNMHGFTLVYIYIYYVYIERTPSLSTNIH